jgi:serine/threonine protein kinase
MAPEAMSPESGFDPEEPSTFVSPRSDVYSFGMTILEVSLTWPPRRLFSECMFYF